MNSPRRDPTTASEQDGAPPSPSSLSDPEDRQTPGEADEQRLAAEQDVDISGELTDVLADAGQEAGEDGKAFSAEETMIQQTSVDEPGGPSLANRPARPRAPMPRPRLEEPRPAPPSAQNWDTDQYESSGEISDVVQDARQEPGADNAAQHAEDHAPDG